MYGAKKEAIALKNWPKVSVLATFSPLTILPINGFKEVCIKVLPIPNKMNEVNMMPYIVDKAYEKGMQIALNPSPFNEKLDAVDMKKISIFLLNEVEGFQLTGEKETEAIIAKLRELFPHARIMLTLGKDGAVYVDAQQKVFQPIFKVKAVDTTAAGDTFTGYFLAGLAEGLPMEQVLRMSAKASSIAVTREGAVPSIPYRAEVLEALQA